MATTLPKYLIILHFKFIIIRSSLRVNGMTLQEQTWSMKMGFCNQDLDSSLLQEENAIFNLHTVHKGKYIVTER